MTVIYAEVPSYKNYKVGDDGSLWTKRVRGSKFGSISGQWQERTGQKTKSGYIRDSITNDEGTIRVRRHQLILLAFIGPCPEGMEGCHENDVKSDNRLTNLSWGTRSKNCKDAYRNRVSGGELSGHAKLSWAKAKEIRNLYPNGWSLGQLAQKYSVSTSTILQVVSGRTWKDGSGPIKHRNARSGSDHGMAKLTWDKVREIRSEYGDGGVTQIELAKKHGIGESSIKRVIDQKTWKE